MPKGGGGMPPVGWVSRCNSAIVLELSRSHIPGKANGGGGKPGPPIGGPPCGTSIGLAPAWPSAA